MRLKVIDWLYEVVNKCGIKDRALIFHTIELMD